MPGFDLREAVSVTRWSPRATFGPARQLSERVHALGNGFYLRTNPRRGSDDPVLSVGWAESDYWARRVWDLPPYQGDLSVPPAQWRPPPSLAFLDRPEHLTFEGVRHFEQERLGKPAPTMINARYRLTDGAFLCVEVRGADGVFYYFGSTGPEPADEPVAIEIRLPDTG